MKRNRIIPKFSSDADEAKWWDRNRNQTEKDMLAALAAGKTSRGAAAALARRGRPSKNITIRMPLDDLERAQRLSAKKGIGYQTFMRMLLHEALTREEAG
ncbi:MAG: hypothetical protein HY822_08215 [Acidobacteria bacterium]|nr:hypothetical protein [Acidobacteriota bacterium]